MNKRTVTLATAAAMLLLVAFISSGITLLLSKGDDSGIVRMVSQEDYETLRRYQRLEEVRSTLVSEYYLPLDENALITGAIRGMMDSIDDPYTFYYTPDEMAQSNEQSDGIFHGVGMVVQLSESGYIEIIRIYPDSPAEKCGLQVGDQLIQIDGKPVSGESAKTLNDAVEMIQGEDGTPVILTVLRGEEELDFEAFRAAVSVSHVDYHILNESFGYVSIAQFSGDDVSGFKNAVEAFKTAGITGMIVDLRNNPGGLLTDVVAIADLVLPEGLITYVEDRHGNRQEEHSDAEYWDVPMVVLVNGMSASASELFTAAVQDYERATVVGTQTFGKGIVQTLLTFSEDGAGMQYTTASYYSPNGRTIHNAGIEPDVWVDASDEYEGSLVAPDPKTDNQLAVALEELEKRIIAEN